MVAIDEVDRRAFIARLEMARAESIDVDGILGRLVKGCSLRKVRAGCQLTLEQYLQLQKLLRDEIREAIYQQTGMRPLTHQEQQIAVYYMVGAEDLGAALARLGIFSEMMRDRLRNEEVQFNVRDGIARLFMKASGGADVHQRFAYHYAQEYCEMIEVLSWFIGEAIPLARLEVPFKPDEHTRWYLQRLNCPVSHGHRSFGFYFSETLLQRPIIRSLDAVASYLKMLPAMSTGHDDNADFDRRVERLLERQCLEAGGMPTAAELACALNMSDTTLRRRLSDAGRSYSEIKRSCQLRLGKELLSKPYSKLFEVAQRLGFHDVNAFRRVFKDATGLTPQEYHRNCGGTSTFRRSA
jgi:AraC-like DNA-binding protein